MKVNASAPTRPKSLRRHLFTEYLKTRHILLLFLLLSSQGLFAQQLININKENSGLRSSGQFLPEQIDDYYLDKPEQARTFDINPRIKALTRENEGDILLLDLFEENQYRALVEKVTRGDNGTTGITARVEGANFGYCYISASEENTLIHVDLLEKNSYYIATTNAGSGHLFEYNKATLDANRLPCQSVMPPEQPGSISTEALPLYTTPAYIPTIPANTRADETTINVMVVYTAKAKAWAENRKSTIVDEINLAMQKANLASTNSNLGITFRLAYTHATDYQEVNSGDDLDRLTNPTDGYMDEIHGLRRKYEADLVMLVPEVDFTGGVGWVMGDKKGNPAYGFALSRVQQLSYTTTMVHEMAHNMGCGHHREQSTQKGPGLFNYAAGWKGIINGENKCTIMTYGDKSYWGGSVSYAEIPYFSSPDIIYPGSTVVIGDAETADNARTLRETKYVTAAYKDIINETILTDLKVDGVTIEGFDPDIPTYAYTTDQKTISITGYSTYATISGNITDVVLNNGKNHFTIVAISKDSTFRKSYPVTVTRVAAACESALSLPAFSGDVSASSGDDALNLNMQAASLIAENSYTLSLSYGYYPVYIRKGEESTSCHSLGDGGIYGVYRKELPIKVTEEGDYTFTVNESLILTLYSTEEPSCEGFLGSSAYWSGNATTTYYGNELTVSLKANTAYYLHVMYYSDPDNQYHITTSGPGTSYAEIATPKGMSYTYIAVDQSDNKIKKHSSTADFRSLPAGSYTIYGIPYSHGSKADNFIGKTTSEIQNSDCVILSKTSILMTVGAGVVHAEAPVISLHPRDTTYTIGESATPLTVTASVGDGGVLSYQWYANTTNKTTGGTSLGSSDGAQTDTYTPSTATIGTTYYYVVVTNTNQSVDGNQQVSTTSNAATVIIKAIPTYGVSIGSFTGGSVRAASPNSSNGSAVLAGETVTLTINITDGYQLESIAAHKTGSQGTNVPLEGSGDEDGATRTFTMPEYAVTVTALFTKTQEKQDEEAVELAKEAVEGGTYRVAQAAGNTEESIRAWLVNTLNSLFASSHQVEFRSAEAAMVGYVEIISFTPAIAGTEEDPEGRDGSFTYTVSLTLGATTLSTETTSGTILAIPYTATPEKRIELSLLNELTVHILNSGNVATGELTLALSGDNADVFTLPSATIASLAVGAETDVILSISDDLPTGTYKATLTVSGEDLAAVSQEITCMVTGTALAALPTETLNASVQNGQLYVSGLIPGKPWRIYSISGILIHQAVAEKTEENKPLASRGVYIITSGPNRLKVVY